jgi:hypothetical protein
MIAAMTSSPVLATFSFPKRSQGTAKRFPEGGGIVRVVTRVKMLLLRHATVVGPSSMGLLPREGKSFVMNRFSWGGELFFLGGV